MPDTTRLAKKSGLWAFTLGLFALVCVVMPVMVNAGDGPDRAYGNTLEDLRDQITRKRATIIKMIMREREEAELNKVAIREQYQQYQTEVPFLKKEEEVLRAEVKKMESDLAAKREALTDAVARCRVSEAKLEELSKAVAMQEDVDKMVDQMKKYMENNK